MRWEGRGRHRSGSQDTSAVDPLNRGVDTPRKARPTVTSAQPHAIVRTLRVTSVPSYTDHDRWQSERPARFLAHVRSLGSAPSHLDSVSTSREQIAYMIPVPRIPKTRATPTTGAARSCSFEIEPIGEQR